MKFLSQVYISIYNVKTSLLECLVKIKEFLSIFLPVASDPELADRPGWSTARSTEPASSRSGGRLTCTDLCTSAGTMGRSTGRSTGPESFAPCIQAVDRAIDRDCPTVIFMTVGGQLSWPADRQPVRLPDQPNGQFCFGAINTPLLGIFN